MQGKASPVVLYAPRSAFNHSLRESLETEFRALDAFPALEPSLAEVEKIKVVGTTTGTGYFRSRSHFLIHFAYGMAMVLSRYSHTLFASVHAHAAHVQSDMSHPLHALALMASLAECFGETLPRRTLAWLGGGSNLQLDLISTCAMLGVNVRVVGGGAGANGAGSSPARSQCTGGELR